MTKQNLKLLSKNTGSVTNQELSDHQLNDIFDSIDDAIIIHDQAGNIVECNEAACRIFEYSKQEMCSIKTEVIDTPEFAAGYLERLTHQLKQKRYRCEGVHVTKTGRRIPTDVVCSVILFRNEQMVLSIIRDMSALKKAEQENRELERQVLHKQKLESLGTMAGGIAHDFNNLLMGVLGNVDLIIDSEDVPITSRQRLFDIRTTAERAADLCRQLLAYSGKGQFMIEAVSLNDLVSEMGGLLQVSLSKNAIVTYELGSSLPKVEVDLAQMRQVIINLMTNAAESKIEATVNITIATKLVHLNHEFIKTCQLSEGASTGEYVLLQVTDNGSGMSEETLAKIFEPFFTTKETGHGLGLSAVLGIVRGHRGLLKVVTEVNQGTTFSIYLPMTESITKKIELTPNKIGRLKCSTVLLVDDEPMVRNVSKQMLAHLGLQVMEAADGAAALSIYRQHFRAISLVLLDLSMPGMSGHDVLMQFRIINPEVRVILSSGYNEHDIKMKYSADNLTSFIQKPYRLEQLQRVIEATAKES